jgi:hypothetical protein
MDDEELYRNQQEFLRFCEESEKDIKKYEKKIATYKKKLFNFIVTLTYTYYPETLTESKNKIKEEIQFHFSTLFEDVDALLSGIEIKAEHLIDYTITHTNLEEELQMLNRDRVKYAIPIDDPDYLEDIAYLKWTVNNEQYRDEILLMSKKLLLEQFPEIENLSSNSFLQLAFSTKRFAGELVVGINYIVCNELI